MHTDPGDVWRRRIRALLDKARSTPYPEEAEALVAKAHQLLERYSIDEASLAPSNADPDRIRVEDVVMRPPYARARTSLLATVARHSRCRAILLDTTSDGTRCAVVGHDRDLEHALATFRVLELHAVRAMRAEVDPTGRPRAFRHAFLLAYAARIGERLRAARQAAREELDGGGPHAASLALLDRESAVTRAVEEHFPHLRRVRSSVSSASGARSGRAAAAGADLGQARLAGRRALGAG